MSRGDAGGGREGGGRGGFAAARALNAELARAPGRARIWALVSEHHATMNSVNCATALHRLAKAAPAKLTLGGTDAHWKKSLGAAAASAARAAAEAAAASAPGAADAEARLCTRTVAVLRSVAEEVSPRSLTSIAWAVGRLGLCHAGLLDAIAARAAALLGRGKLDAFGQANVAWAIATLHAAAERASGRDRDLGCASEAVPPHPELLDALASAACSMPASFSPQETTNVLWAFATLGLRHERLFDSLCAAAAGRMGEFTPQGLSQTLWACAKLGLPKPALFHAAAASALGRLPTFDPQVSSDGLGRVWLGGACACLERWAG
jgi:hypothetical protein